MAEVTVKILEDGPLLVSGAIDIVDHSGNPVPPPTGKSVIALCRCGASTNKPFCDGTHSKIGFRGAEKAVAEASQGEEI